ncbi:MAG: sortase [Actinomycetota bacterium]|nr:sortase [Actinomycetota bacterium]
MVALPDNDGRTVAVTTTQDHGGLIDLRDHNRPPGDVLVSAPPTDAPPRETARSEPARPPSAPPGRQRSDTATVVSHGLTAFSLLVAAMIAFLFVFSGFAEARAQVGLRRSFETAVADLKAPIGGAIANGVPVAEIDVAAIGLHRIVVQGTTSSALRSGPGHLRQSPLPGQQGNAVVIGRKTAYGGAFRRISSLTKGDRISVTTGEGRFSYIVDTVRRVGADNGSELVSTGTNQLTLVTSDPAFLATRRLVVTSHLIGNAFAPSADPTPVTRAELGLSGETDAVLPLVLWLEVLLAAAIGATWLWRRWARWSAYVVSVPVLLAITWLVFENVTKLLPATL